jgi:hypothetical protein
LRRFGKISFKERILVEFDDVSRVKVVDLEEPSVRGGTSKDGFTTNTRLVLGVLGASKCG